ncbi:MAG: N-acetyl-gamma-glutamyl-phosphate reductase [Saprospiraceae bacterium]
MIRIGIAGASGYTAGELLRLLKLHPRAEISWCYSHSQAGKAAAELHEGLLDSDVVFTDTVTDNVDVVFLCLGHGNSNKWLERFLPSLSESVKIIDLSADFRRGAEANPTTKDWPVAHGRTWVYGLPEVSKEAIENADAIANPGCFATALQLALLPLAEEGLLTEEIHANAVTGSTGAGQNPSATTHFSWRTNNLSSYKTFTHQHLGEVRATLSEQSSSQLPTLRFVPIRGDFARGIFATIYTPCSLSQHDMSELYKNRFENHPFSTVSLQSVHLKQAVNTNHAVINVQAIDGQAFISIAIDNLLKGAVGQAVENMNLMFGLPQVTGLNLKASAF